MPQLLYLTSIPTLITSHPPPVSTKTRFTSSYKNMNPFTHNPGPESLRWLGIAEKLLNNNDLIGSKTFATRARESDPSLHQPDQILAIIDTLIAAEKQISNNHLDWYAILQLARRTHDSELIASQYHRLGVLLNPNCNKFAFSEHAFKLVTEAWLVLSNQNRKFHFDNELENYNINHSSNHNSTFNFMQPQHYEQVQHSSGRGSSSRGHFNFMQERSEQLHQSEPMQFLQPFVQQQLFPQQQVTQALQHEVHWSNLNQQLPQQTWLQPPLHWSQVSQTSATAPVLHPQPRLQQHFAMPQMQEAAWTHQPLQSRERVENGVDFNLGRNGDSRENNVNVEELPDFWTACAYCYTMHEYSGMYAECTLKCQNCKKAFHAVKIEAPPVEEEGEDGYYRCWGYFPIGISTAYLEERKTGASSWTPFSTMFGAPKGCNMGKPKNVRNSGPRIYIDEDEDIFDGISSNEETDEDWSSGPRNKKGRNFTRKVSLTKKVKQPQGYRAEKVQERNMGNVHSGVVAQEGQGVSVPKAAVPSVPNAAVPSVPDAAVPSVPVGEAKKAAGETSNKRVAVSTQQSNQVELERMWRGWI